MIKYGGGNLGRGNPSNERDEWGTPQESFDKLDREFCFTMDPCASAIRPLKQGMISYGKQDNGLIQDWSDQRAFVNPPYTGRDTIRDWCRKCYEEKDRTELIVLLVPSVKVCTSYFCEYVKPYAALRFTEGRLNFFPLVGQKTNSNPTGSVICIFRRSIIFPSVRDALEDLGKLRERRV